MPVPVHPSHEVLLDYDVPSDRHNPAYRCTVCEETACSMCELEEGDALAVTCLGFPWHQGIEVTGDDGITRTARRCGTGWPKGRATPYTRV